MFILNLPFVSVVLVHECFLEGSKNDIGIPNVVTNILASYRGYDTFGEVVVIFTAGVAVVVLLSDLKNKIKLSKSK